MFDAEVNSSLSDYLTLPKEAFFEQLLFSHLCVNVFLSHKEDNMIVEKLTSDLFLEFWVRVGKVFGLDSSAVRDWFSGEGKFGIRYFVAVDKRNVVGTAIWKIQNILGGNKITLDLALCEASGYARRQLLLGSLAKMCQEFDILEIHGAVDEEKELEWFQQALQGISEKPFRTMLTDLPGKYFYFTLTL
ncbi:MAG: hypothetical protein Q8N56_02810 [bacterium]|nr:hypothetical protein [bacterium]